MNTGLVAATLRLPSGEHLSAGAGRWCGPLTSDDDELLARAAPPVLDIGCGPGRHVLALAERGKIALGIDLTPPVVALARRRGAPVLHRSVFARVPGAGRWRTALLLDGNVGIGGDPVGLLRRVAALLCRDGAALVELEPPGRAGRVTTARLELDGSSGPWFPWTQLSIEELAGVATSSQMIVTETWRRGSRWFAELRKPRLVAPES
jgi:SAM-dependent methyltransferase